MTTKQSLTQGQIDHPEFAYIVVRYPSGIHRVQKIRNGCNGWIQWKSFHECWMQVDKRNRWLEKAFLTYDEAWEAMKIAQGKYVTKLVKDAEWYVEKLRSVERTLARIENYTKFIGFMENNTRLLKHEP